MRIHFDYAPEWDGGDLRASPGGSMRFKSGGLLS